MQAYKEKIVLKILCDESYKKPCGFHLTRTKWDPYPWIGYVEDGSAADAAGLRPGDCLLEIDDIDLVGLKIKDIAEIIREKGCGQETDLKVWRYESGSEVDQEKRKAESKSALEGPLPEIVKKLAGAISGTVKTLECPVCLESATPPVSQCVHGHILCMDCRPKTLRCPICRVRLGQGRCLLADTLHKVLSDSFRGQEEVEHGKSHRSLKERIFGLGSKSEQQTLDTKSSSSKPKQMSLAKILLGGFEKAVSADNLSTMERDDLRGKERSFARRLNERLGEHDRTKSASTSELDAPSSGLLSVPRTPLWGGSTESVSNATLSCPLILGTGCSENITANTLMEHLSLAHEGPVIHFHNGHANLQLPLPFGLNAAYLIHHQGEVFSFQLIEESAFVATPGTTCSWDWILHGWSEDGTQMKLKRRVARLDDLPSPESQNHSIYFAPIPATLSICKLKIQILDSSRVVQVVDI